MTNIDNEFDLKLEKQEELAREAEHEFMMRGDIDYTLHRLEVYKITESIEELKTKLAEYGHELSYREIMDYLI